MSIAVLVFGVVGCGTSGCDNEDIAKQALDILLQKSGMSAEKLGARAVNIVMLDKEKNVCSADIWLKPVSNIEQELEKDYMKQMVNTYPLLVENFVEHLVTAEALKLMGISAKVRYEQNKGNYYVIAQDGKPFELSSLDFTQIAQLKATRDLLNTLAKTSINYQVTSGDKGEYIIAEPAEGNQATYKQDPKNGVDLVEVVQVSNEPIAEPEIQNRNESIEPKQEVQSETPISNESIAQQENAANEPNSTPQPESTANSSQNQATPSPAPSAASASDKLPSIKLATKDDYVNLRKAPSGEILAPIYKKDFDKITLKKLDGGNEKWLKVLYFAPNVTDKSQAITGYIHISQIAK